MPLLQYFDAGCYKDELEQVVLRRAELFNQFSSLPGVKTKEQACQPLT